MLDADNCSYCEKPASEQCAVCFGCRECCPDGEHCGDCGQSLKWCEKTMCGGTKCGS